MKLTKSQLEARKKKRERNRPLRMAWKRYFKQVIKTYNLERRITMSEDWEQCFLPLDNPNCIKPPSVTTCAHCEDIIHRDTCFSEEYYNGQMMDTEHWCDQECHDKWYINRLNERGL